MNKYDEYIHTQTGLIYLWLPYLKRLTLVAQWQINTMSLFGIYIFKIGSILSLTTLCDCQTIFVYFDFGKTAEIWFITKCGVLIIGQVPCVDPRRIAAVFTCCTSNLPSVTKTIQILC